MEGATIDMRYVTETNFITLSLLCGTIISGGIVLAIGCIMSRLFRSREPTDSAKRVTSEDSKLSSSVRARPATSNSRLGKRFKSPTRHSSLVLPWLVSSLKGHTSNVTDMDLSSNGKHLATCAADTVGPFEQCNCEVLYDADCEMETDTSFSSSISEEFDIRPEMTPNTSIETSASRFTFDFKPEATSNTSIETSTSRFTFRYKPEATSNTSIETSTSGFTFGIWPEATSNTSMETSTPEFTFNYLPEAMSNTYIETSTPEFTFGYIPEATSNTYIETYTPEFTFGCTPKATSDTYIETSTPEFTLDCTPEETSDTYIETSTPEVTFDCKPEATSETSIQTSTPEVTFDIRPEATSKAPIETSTPGFTFGIRPEETSKTPIETPTRGFTLGYTPKAMINTSTEPSIPGFTFDISPEATSNTFMKSSTLESMFQHCTNITATFTPPSLSKKWRHLAANATEGMFRRSITYDNHIATRNTSSSCKFPRRVAKIASSSAHDEESETRPRLICTHKGNDVTGINDCDLCKQLNLLNSYVLSENELYEAGYPRSCGGSDFGGFAKILYYSFDVKLSGSCKKTSSDDNAQLNPDARVFSPISGTTVLDTDSGHGSDGSLDSSDMEQENISDNETDNLLSLTASTPKKESLISRTCTRCNVTFNICSISGRQLTEGKCRYHWGKQRPLHGTKHTIWSCCDQKTGTAGCNNSDLHVWIDLKEGLNEPLPGFVCTQSVYGSGERRYLNKEHFSPSAYGIDCEMSFTTHGFEVTKVTIVDFDGKIKYEEFVIPEGKIIDYNTRFSGVKESDISSSTKTFRMVQQEICELIFAETILIGHSVENDLRALRIVHSKVVDVSTLYPHWLGPPYRHSLKNMAKCILRRSIQMGMHDSAEDAQTAVDLVKHFLNTS